jgi:Repeat of Unknown Function (DUF347)
VWRNLNCSRSKKLRWRNGEIGGCRRNYPVGKVSQEKPLGAAIRIESLKCFFFQDCNSAERPRSQRRFLSLADSFKLTAILQVKVRHVSLRGTGAMNKLPEITIYFWIMKICATTLGETGGDLLTMTLNVGYATSSLILIGLFLIALVSQLLSKQYHPFLYWTVILSTSTAGTTMSDYMDRTLGLGYTAGSLILLTVLLVIFALWRLSGGFFLRH